MNFVVDEQLPPALAGWIEGRGHTAQHLQDLGLLSAKDQGVWLYCSSPPSVIVTKDEDFVERRSRSAEGPQVLWVRIGNATNDALLTWLSLRWDYAVGALQSGAVVVELR